jgi:hypothetical protein
MTKKVKRLILSQDAAEVKPPLSQAKSPGTTALYQTTKIWKPNQFPGQLLTKVAASLKIIAVQTKL